MEGLLALRSLVGASGSGGAGSQGAKGVKEDTGALGQKRRNRPTHYRQENRYGQSTTSNIEKQVFNTRL